MVLKMYYIVKLWPNYSRPHVSRRLGLLYFVNPTVQTYLVCVEMMQLQPVGTLSAV